VKGKRRLDPLGDALTALCGGALAFNLLLVVGLLVVLAVNGMGYFWQDPLLRVELDDGTVVLGEVVEREEIPRARSATGAAQTRIRLKVGNRDVDGVDFVWVDEPRIVSRAHPGDAVLLERLEWGNFYGTLVELRSGEEVLASGPEQVWEAFGPLHERKLDDVAEVRRIERVEIGGVSNRMEKLRLAQRKLELQPLDAAADAERREAIEQEAATARAEYEALSRRLFALREELLSETLVVATAGGTRRTIPVGHVVRALRPNAMGPHRRSACTSSAAGSSYPTTRASPTPRAGSSPRSSAR
jgi:phosphate transport system permease protein